jgi:hypothetical protein
MTHSFHYENDHLVIRRRCSEEFYEEDKQDNVLVQLKNTATTKTQPQVQTKPGEILFREHFKDPQVPLISVDLSNPRSDKSQGSLRIQAMHNSGCAKTTIRTNIFKRIPNAEKIQINQMPNVYVQSCSGEKSKILGHAALKFTFHGDEGKEASFIHDVLITDFVQGRDFSGSNAMVLETNTHLYLSTTIENVDEDGFPQSDSYVRVPIISKTSPKLPIVAATTDIIIPPQTLVSIPCHLTDCDASLASRTPNDLVYFEIQNIRIPYVRIPDTLLSFQKDSKIDWPLFNSSFEGIIIPAHAKVANIQLKNEEFTLYKLQVSHESPNRDYTLQLNSLKNIQMDEELNEEERQRAFNDYLETGSYDKSMTKVIEDSQSVTGLELQDVKSWTNDNFDEQFSLEHLPQKKKRQALKVFRKHSQVFSRNEMDIGKAKGIEMEIEIDNTKPRIQKYFPLPLNVREGVRKILDQMLEFRI